MRDVYKNINHYNPCKENKILTVFDDMIADMINNMKLNSIVTELFIRGRKLNISLSTPASDNPLRFRKLFLECNKNHDNDQIRDEKLQYDFSREAAKISA